jgi:hypothetical protein
VTKSEVKRLHVLTGLSEAELRKAEQIQAEMKVTFREAVKRVREMRDAQQE